MAHPPAATFQVEPFLLFLGNQSAGLGPRETQRQLQWLPRVPGQVEEGHEAVVFIVAVADVSLYDPPAAIPARYGRERRVRRGSVDGPMLQGNAVGRVVPLDPGARNARSRPARILAGREIDVMRG